MVIVLRELIKNALKYTQDEVIDITIDFEWNEGEATSFYGITVIDHGLGISTESLEYVFNEFYHHDFINIYREDEDVSLPMCKQMMLSSGGDLFVKSSLGEGSEFTIILPIYFS